MSLWKACLSALCLSLAASQGVAAEPPFATERLCLGYFTAEIPEGFRLVQSSGARSVAVQPLGGTCPPGPDASLPASGALLSSEALFSGGGPDTSLEIMVSVGQTALNLAVALAPVEVPSWAEQRRREAGGLIGDELVFLPAREPGERPAPVFDEMGFIVFDGERTIFVFRGSSPGDDPQLFLAARLRTAQPRDQRRESAEERERLRQVWAHFLATLTRRR